MRYTTSILSSKRGKRPPVERERTPLLLADRGWTATSGYT